ncbi:DUF448 domain-containing protein [Campylobacter sp. FMV-PI01]|uniref:DUF448 domain-containing protein n=1 Tax=Campylobacter portucalensis TaxID=2608384 RepID=A0A6L5WJ24_9BACT|nr:DUF448 domain-containing protein [Campylobacter portucalensis]MSN95833.1 DUF448 domain-containing protein [Campylobacter portucalensis]
MRKKFKPVRMCVVCRTRYYKDELLKFNQKNILNFDSVGRSFYICRDCICKDDKILKKYISKITKIDNINLEKIKESVLYGGCSHK